MQGLLLCNHLPELAVQNDFPKGLDPPGLNDAANRVTEVPYEGRHILEIMGVKETDGDTLLDSYLKDIEDFEVRPVLRYDHIVETYRRHKLSLRNFKTPEPCCRHPAIVTIYIDCHIPAPF